MGNQFVLKSRGLLFGEFQTTAQMPPSTEVTEQFTVDIEVTSVFDFETFVLLALLTVEGVDEVVAELLYKRIVIFSQVVGAERHIVLLVPYVTVVVGPKRRFPHLHKTLDFLFHTCITAIIVPN